MFKDIGTLSESRTQEIFDLFTPVEGRNAVYYGKVRNGKTRTATADILELLRRGEVVYANWQINFEDYDERFDFKVVLLKIFGRRDKFFVYKKDNFHFINPVGLIDGTGSMTIKKMNDIVGAHFFIDEGQWIFPSMDRTYDEETIERMKLVLHGGHYCRSLNIITQRPQNISKNARSQIHVWYRCVKRLDMFGWILFQRWEIEDMKDDLPVEYDSEGSPLGDLKTYWCHKKTDKVFSSYNTHAMREKGAVEARAEVLVYKLTFFQKLLALWRILTARPDTAERDMTQDKE